MTTVSAVATARVRTVPLGPARELLAALPPTGGLAWVRDGEGLVGWGEAARLRVGGPDRFAEAARWWRQQVAACTVEDEVGLPGCGPVAFGSFAFADRPGDSVLVMPRVVLGCRDGVAWLTTVGPAGGEADGAGGRPAPEPPGELRWSDGSRPVTAWRGVVAEAVRRIRAGELAKVVLALDLRADAEFPVDPRWLTGRLARRYPSCWTFAVDGLVGATPELLVRRDSHRVLSRVLAGTVRRGADPAEDERLAQSLRSSAKEASEHRLAVSSVAAGLGRHCTGVSAGEPYLLRLANVAHLATDVTGTATGGATALDLAAALHPTAAVGGAPTAAAVSLIDELEGLDRARYAGPVGWVDARGDGEWGIALRCAEVAGSRVRLFAGCGIVADSDPDAEVAEWLTKLLPIREALGSR